MLSFSFIDNTSHRLDSKIIGSLYIIVIVIMLGGGVFNMKSIMFFGLYSLITLTIVHVVYHSIFSKKIESGQMIFYSDKILLERSNLTKIFEMDNMTRILIEYSNYRGGMGFGGGLNLYISSGWDNHIVFEYKGEQYEYFFLSKNPKDYKNLKKIIKLWSKYNFSITLKT